MRDSDPDQFVKAWRVAQVRLPAGWALEGLRCASTGLERPERSDDWIALAAGPDSERRTYQAHDGLAALEGVALGFEANELEGG